MAQVTITVVLTPQANGPPHIGVTSPNAIGAAEIIGVLEEAAAGVKRSVLQALVENPGIQVAPADLLNRLPNGFVRN